MLKWIMLITAAVILFAVLFYHLFLYSPVYVVKYREHDMKIEELTSSNVNYIVTSRVSGRISIREIDSITSFKNFVFTRVNLNDSLRRSIPDKIY